MTNHGLTARAAACISSINRATSKLFRSTFASAKITGLVDARLLVTFVAIALVATVLTATAYMQTSGFQEKNESQETKKQQPAPSNGEGPLDVPSTGPSAQANIDPAAAEMARLFKDSALAPQAVNNYAVTRTTGITFSSISGTGTSVTSWRNTTSLDDNLSNTQPIGFTFLYNGGAYQNFRVSTNGFITFNTSSTAVGGTSATPYNYENLGLSSSSASANFSPLTLAPMWDDLTVPAAGTLSGNIKYLTTGVSPNRILTVEFIGLETFGNAGPDLNFQTKLYELDGHIEYVYGTMTASTSTYTYTTGLNASTVSATPTAAELLTQQTANTATFNNTASNSLSTIPATNTQLTFTPPATTPAAATNLTFPTIGSSFVTLNWTDNATNETNYNVLISFDGGTTYQTFGAIFGANTTGVTITGLTASTTYFFRVLACTEGVCSTPLNSSVTTNAPVSGTKTIGPGGDYPTFALAVSDVNAGVGGAGVTFNVTSGTTFAENGTCITGGALATPVVFQKSGAGANPIIQPPGSSSTQDSGICILGGDYITFDGIDVAVAGGNTTVEYGALVFNSSATNGAQNNTIKNSKITLDRTNTGSIGINQTLSIAATAASGANSTNKYYNITVENASRGILLNGTSTTIVDTNNEIGVTGGGKTTIGAATANDIGNGTAQTYGIRSLNQSGVKIFNAEVRNVTGTSTNSVDGIIMDNTLNSSTVSAGTCEIYNNQVHDIKNTSASATTHILSGIRANLTTNAASVSRVYNNFIYGLDNSSTATSRQIIGIRVQDGGSGSGATQNIDFNSVRLAPTGVLCSNTTFEIGSTSGPVIKVRDNIFANFTGTQTASAKHYTWVTTSSTSIGPAGSVSNNNDLYVNNTTNAFIALNTSTPTDYATLAAWKAFAAAPDANSISSDPLFFAATDLHIPTNSPAVDAGSFFAGAITWAGTDIDAQTRPNGATNPDIGADEPYATPGTVQFSSAAYSVLETGVTATITVTRTGGSNGAASVNYATSNGTATGGASCTAGVDYISTSGTLNWADLDAASKTFTVSICNDGVPEASETVNLALSTAVTASLGTPNTAVLTITNAADVFNGSVNVGTGQAYTSLTNPSGLFENINNGTVAASTTVNITSDLTGETGAVSLNQTTESGAGGYTITFRPSGGVTRNVIGASSTALINLNGADRIVFDGLNTGGNTLTIRNTDTSGATIRFINDASSNTVQNCSIEGATTSSTNGVIFLSTGTTTGNDNNTITNSTIRDRSDVNAVPANLIYSSGSSSTITNTTIGVTNNTLKNYTSNGIQLVGTGSSNGNESWTISGNTFFQEAARTTTLSGITFTSIGTNSIATNTVRDLNTSSSATGIVLTDARSTTVSRNRIYSFPSTSGSTGTLIGIQFTGSSGNPASATLADNMISIIPSFTNSQTIRGIYDFGFTGNTFNAFYNSAFIGGTASGSTTWACERGGSAPTTYTAKDNICFNNRTGGSVNHYAGGDESGGTGTFVSDNNYFIGTGTTAANFMDYNGTSVSFATWKTGPPARDAASTAGVASGFTVANLFANSATADLHLIRTSPSVPSIFENIGTPVSVTNDFDNDTRDVTLPDIGADEVTTMQFSSTTYSVAENGGLATITVTRTAGSGNPGTVNYATSPGAGTAAGTGTCTAGDDYLTTSGTLSFAATETTKTFDIPICNDAVFEAAETVNLSLNTPTGSIIGTPNTAVLTITDDDTAPTISIDSVSVSEGGGNAVFTVTQSFTTGVNTTFTYSTANGSATSPADYTGATDVPKTITAGTTTTTISVPIIQDALTEGSETFTVTLANPVNATIATGTGTGTITDDDLTFNADGNLPAGTYDNVTINGNCPTQTYVTLTGDVVVTGTFTINACGQLYTNGFTVSGPASSSFVLNAAGWLHITSPQGITAAPTAAGNIQTNSRTFSSGASYDYDGSAAQVTGNGLPASVSDLLITNSNGVSLTANLTVNGALTLTSGAFGVGANTLTLNSTVTAAGGTLTSAAGGTVNYNQSSNGQNVLAANYGTLVFSNFNKVLSPTGTIGITTSFSPGTATGHTVTGSTIEYHLAANTVNTTTILPPAFTHYNNLSINELGNTVGPPGLVVDDTLHLLLGTFTSASDYDNVVIDPGTTLSLAGNITVSGNWTNNGTFLANGKGVTFDGNTAQSISGSTPSAFAGLTISNSGNVVTLNQNASDTSLSVTSGTFSQAGTSDLTSGAASVSAGATWSNLAQGDLTLSGDVSNAGTITFNANGAGCGDTDDILIRSSSNGVQRGWSGAGTFNMTDVDVKDQKAPLLTPPPVAIVVTSGTNSGNNSGWAFSGTCTAGTYTWVGTVSTDYQVPANWSPTRAVPAAGDVLILDGTATPGPIITNVPTQTIAALRLVNSVAATLNASAIAPPQTLTVSGATGMDLTIPTSSRLTLAGTNGLTINVAAGSLATVGGLFIMQDGPHRLLGNAANAITFQSGSLCTLAPSYSSTVNPFGTGGPANGAAGSVIFEAASIYTHNNGESPFGVVANPPVAVFQNGSVARWFSNNGFQPRTYSTLIIGDGLTAITISSSGTDPFEFTSLTVNSTANANSSLTASVGGNVNIKGDISSTGSGNGAAVPDVTLLSSTNIVIAKTLAGTINFSNDVGSNRTVKFGNATPGSGNATVNTGNTLVLGRKLVVDTNSAITVVGGLNGDATGYVIGKEKRAYTGAELFVYHVGTASGYAPLDANITAGTGDLTTEGKQPQQPVLTAGTSLQRYWTLTEGGAITADLTFHYNQADVMGTESNYRLIIVEGTNATQFPENCPDVACVDETANTIRRTGVQTFSDWTAGEPNAPTAVKLTGFTALQSDGEVMLQWQTGYEARNLGYIVYREQDGKRVQITPSLVAGSALIAGNQTRLTAGLSYTWYDQPVAKGNGEEVKGTQNSELRTQNSPVGGQRSGVSYWLEDVDLNGTRTLHGPIAPAISIDQPKGGRLRADLIGEVSQRTAASGVQFSGWPAASADEQTAGETAPQGAAEDPSMSATGAASDPFEVQRQIAGMPGVKLAISKPGWYRVTKPELQAAGLDTKEAQLLQVFTGGVEVPIRLSGDGQSFTAADYFEFYGEGLQSPTDSAKTYYVVVGKTRGKRVARRETTPTQATNSPSFAYTIERKERMTYFSGLLNGDSENFFGQIVSMTPVSASMPAVHLDQASSAPAQLELSLQGVTGQSHLVQVRFNGTDLGTVNFANTEHPSQVFAVPASALLAGDNTVQLTSLGGSADVSLVDTMRLTYAHTYTADNDSLSFTIANQQTRRVAGFSNSSIRVVDITDPFNVDELKPAITELKSGNFAADIQVSRAGYRRPRRLLVFTNDRTAPADRLTPNDPSSWWSETAGADYLMITKRDSAAALEPLAQLRRNQGMMVSVVDVEDLYDEFTFGEHSPQAIHDFLERATTTWTRQPHYVLLAGDASYDPKNYFGQGLNDLVPTKLIDTALTETASDDWLSDFNNDGIADLAMGRLPARTVAETEAMVGKIVNYENMTPDPSRGALLVADTGFAGQSTAVQNLLPAGLPVSTINRGSADDAGIHNQIIAVINQGPRVANYFGHGSNGVWTGASLLSSNDAPSFTNTNRLSVFTMMTCFNGYFQDAYNDSLSEALLKSQGGAVAVWASTTLTDPGGQSAIDQEFYRLLFGAQPATLGDAARGAKFSTTDADVRRTWTLFGDPAMRLR